MPSSQLAYLLNRYADKTCTPEEREELMRLLQQSENDAAVQQLLDHMIAIRPVKHEMPEQAAAAVLQAIFQADEAPVVPMEEKAPVRWMTRKGIAAAVIILLLGGIGTYLLLNRYKEPAIVKTVPAPASNNDVQPGGNKAILTLADGSTIVLDNAANGMLAQQGGAKVMKLQDGRLSYNWESGAGSQEPIQYNTLKTPRGGQYQLVLPDRTKVWLNAASSIRYPTTFTGEKREVEITGEAYFEVAKVSSPDYRGGREGAMPFVVNVVGRQTVEVLGTHFNINAYDDEGSIKTTLLEGKVKVSSKYEVRNTNKAGSRLSTPDSRLLTPGEQAIMTDHITVTNQISIEETMAWKNGGFYFNGADIQTVMRQVARWYDVDVVYEGQVPTGHFKGKPSRDATLSQMLKMLEYTGVKYSIQGKKIIIKE